MSYHSPKETKKLRLEGLTTMKRVDSFPFTFNSLEKMLSSIKSNGYQSLRMIDYNTNSTGNKRFFLRIDVDFMPEKVPIILDILERNGIKATFFFRVLSPSYNPSSFAMRRLFERIKSDSHEIGLHHESIDASSVLNMSFLEAFQEQMRLLELISGTKIYGTSSHGGLTGLNNQDLFKSFTCEDLGIQYEAYQGDTGLFSNSRYVSDSQWFQWKSYENGTLLQGDARSPKEHTEDNPQNLYFLIHPDTFYVADPLESFKTGN